VISASHLAAFFLASIVIIMVPGPSVLFTLARGVAWGRAVAVLTVLGNSIGTLLLSVVVAVGLGPLLAHSKAFSITLQFAGGCYLLWLGFDAMRHRHAHAHAMTQREQVRPSRIQVIRQGFTVGILNPKSLVFFAAVFEGQRDRAAADLRVHLQRHGLLQRRDVGFHRRNGA
jgi:threonine/homoserine/homoserine lactone efflux protein